MKYKLYLKQRINNCVFRETANTCDKVNAQSYEAVDNTMDIDTIIPVVHTLTLQEKPDATVDG